MPAATRVWSQTFTKALESLPSGAQVRVSEAVDSVGRNLSTAAHHRLQGTDAFRLRVGDYLVIYDFDVTEQRVDLLFVGHRREIYRGL